MACYTPFSDWMCGLPLERLEDRIMVRASVRAHVLGMVALALKAGQ
jgi:hypothetical protein